ncbi:uncharacterized protein PHACADRAFT_188785 [Phanerochaete carnosa HHB-10118-sp]|uniref:Uncharacterized protein n=1 Tax=Phanerochaete carnosa (strain HHB-10118-sp) TaxID=650164 RepID=K5VSJ7_PHACS|nr:uncharacterized protein PHACADRAFT_188785 [Phanerochaete carnosa HHB-10118-sp]EKM49745.1 hypothetical protein PHACADRAFT_188785 [Phanerochaete carnosa HHB-10118-sp]
MTVIGINITALMMLLRGKPLVIGFVAAAFCVEFGTNAWLLSNGIPVRHSSPTIHACTMIFDDSKVGGIASASAWMPLAYDTIVLALTLKRTLGPVRNKTAGKIAKVLLRDGILYYSVIFAVNLVLTLMIATAPPGLQNITAQLEYLLTVTMISRITLHLRKQARSRETDTTLQGRSAVTHSGGGVLSRMRFTRSDGETPIDPMSVTVEESTVTHDDSGIVGGGEPMFPKKGDIGSEEWYEMRRPPATVRIASHARRDSELRFIV